MIDWNIQSRAHACQACAKAYATEETYHTLLFDEKQGYARMDVCEACWTAQYSHGASDRKGFISHWQGVYQPPPAAPPDPIGRETAETLLRKLVELNDPQYTAARYILAVMLERKRLLKVQSQQMRDGRRVFIYEQPKTGDVYAIEDPDLHLDQLHAVQHDVAHLLAHGWSAAVAPLTGPAVTPAPAAETPAPAATEFVEPVPATAEPAANPPEPVAVA